MIMMTGATVNMLYRLNPHPRHQPTQFGITFPTLFALLIHSSWGFFCSYPLFGLIPHFVPPLYSSISSSFQTFISVRFPQKPLLWKFFPFFITIFGAFPVWYAHPQSCQFCSKILQRRVVEGAEVKNDIFGPLPLSPHPPCPVLTAFLLCCFKPQAVQIEARFTAVRSSMPRRDDIFCWL